MNRRTILATTGLSVGCGLAGCLGSVAPTDSSTPGDDGDDPTDDGSTEMTEDEFERCPLVSIDDESLPDAIRSAPRRRGRRIGDAGTRGDRRRQAAQARGRPRGEHGRRVDRDAKRPSDPG